MNVRFRPIEFWPQKNTRNRLGRSYFNSNFNDTLRKLETELTRLGAKDVIIEAGFRESDIRIDGWPKANANQPTHPGIIVSFESKVGPLRYITDQFSFWQHNLRAIALGLEALRKVDRYGITKRGEQYKGWSALPPGTPMPAAQMSVEDAARFIRDNCGDLNINVGGIISVPGTLQRAYLLAAKRLHPDAGGTTESFQKLQEALRVIESEMANA